MRFIYRLSLSFACAALVNADYRVYQPKNQVIFGGSNLTYTTTSTSKTPPAATFTGAAAYDRTILTPPAVPNPPLPPLVPIQLTSSGGIPGLSIPHSGAFFGFSVEMSVVNQVCEFSSHLLHRLPSYTDRHFSGEEQVSRFPRLQLSPEY